VPQKPEDSIVANYSTTGVWFENIWQLLYNSASRQLDNNWEIDLHFYWERVDGVGNAPIA